MRFLYRNAAFQGWSSAVCGPIWGSAVPQAPQGGSSPPPPRPTRHCSLGIRSGCRAPGAPVSIGSQGAPVTHWHTLTCMLSVFVGSLCWITEVPSSRSFLRAFIISAYPVNFDVGYFYFPVQNIFSHPLSICKGRPSGEVCTFQAHNVADGKAGRESKKRAQTHSRCPSLC